MLVVKRQSRQLLGIVCSLLISLSSACDLKAEIKSFSDSTDYGYLKEVVLELQKKWPENRTVNLVFHGHSVPSGYQKGAIVNTFGAYPMQVLKMLSQNYPTAVINVIKTAKGGENAVQGAKRFNADVLDKQPDIVFIDYSLNDRKVGLEGSKNAWGKMIRQALNAKIKVILLTPTPDISENIGDEASPLAKHAQQVKELGNQYHIPVIDSYGEFKRLATEAGGLGMYMAQGNHINARGHQIVAQLIFKLFRDGSR